MVVCVMSIILFCDKLVVVLLLKECRLAELVGYWLSAGPGFDLGFDSSLFWAQ